MKGLTEKQQVKKYKKEIKKLRKKQALESIKAKKEEKLRFKGQVEIERRIPGYHTVFKSKELRDAYDKDENRFSVKKQLAWVISGRTDGKITVRTERKLTRVLIARDRQLTFIGVLFVFFATSLGGIGYLSTQDTVVKSLVQGYNEQVKARVHQEKSHPFIQDNGVFEKVVVEVDREVPKVAVDEDGIERKVITEAKRQYIEAKLNQEPKKQKYKKVRNKDGVLGYNFKTDNILYQPEYNKRFDIFLSLRDELFKHTDLDDNKKYNDELSKER